MRKKILVIVGVAIITLGSLGSYVFAQGRNILRPNDSHGRMAFGRLSAGISSGQQKFGNNQYMGTRNHTNRQEAIDEMIKVMNENGFEDMAKWIKEDDFESINEFMNNMSDEDYRKMVNLMNQNGYHHMPGMMEFFGRDEMINMYNSMMGRYNSKLNRMGGRGCRFW